MAKIVAKMSGPPPIGFECVKASCGHVDGLPLFAKDQFLEQRRRKFEQAPCRKCRELEKLNQQRKSQEELYARRHGQRRRLPDGARFNVVYDAASETWTGSLTIPDEEPLIGTRHAVFSLLKYLDIEHTKRTLAESQTATVDPVHRATVVKGAES